MSGKVDSLVDTASAISSTVPSMRRRGPLQPTDRSLHSTLALPCKPKVFHGAPQPCSTASGNCTVAVGMRIPVCVSCACNGCGAQQSAEILASTPHHMGRIRHCQRDGSACISAPCTPAAKATAADPLHTVPSGFSRRTYPWLHAITAWASHAAGASTAHARLAPNSNPAQASPHPLYAAPAFSERAVMRKRGITESPEARYRPTR